VATANLYIQQTAPWALAREGREAELDGALAALAACLHRHAVLASPFMPGKAQDLWAALGQPGEAAAAAWAGLDRPAVAGARTTKPDNLFPRPA
jgi:methionyl-tRNA synthetase